MQQGVSAPRLEVRGLSRAFGSLQAVRDVSLAIAPGEVHGLCGPNGAGKSTVVKMLSGQLVPDGGTILMEGADADLRSPQAAQRAGVAIVDQELSVVPALSIAENLALGAGRRRLDRNRIRALLAEVGMDGRDPATTLDRLSLGERQLVEIARALGRESTLMILDEPTATLSETEIGRVFAAVRRVAAAGRAVIFVSHRLGEVMALCDRVTVIRDGLVVATTATDRLTMSELITQMVGDAVTASVARDTAPAEGDPVLSVRGLTIDGVLEDFSLDAHAGRIYALAGQLGSGASAAVRALAGLEPAAHGCVELRGRRLPLGRPAAAARSGVAFVSGDRKTEGLFARRTVEDNLVATRLGSLTGAGLFRRGEQRRIAAEVARRVGLRGEQLSVAVASLSGGNQQKVLLGRALGRDDVVAIVLDEPTRGVDVAGRAVIHDLIRAAAADGLAVVFASTDLDELVALGDHVTTIWSGRQVASHPAPAASDVVLSEITHRQASAA